MKDEALKQLYNHPFLNKNALAREVFPDSKPLSAASTLHMKMNGSQGKYLKEEEAARLIQALQGLAREIDAHFPNPDKKARQSEPEPPETEPKLSSIFEKFSPSNI